MLDLKILNGTVLDGTGGPAVLADIGIEGDRIAVVGSLAAAESRRTLDARDRSVCPGFIDAHSHSDVYLLVEPTAPSKIFQGVTTEVVGNCGTSAAPMTGHYRMPSDWSAVPLPGTWKTVAEFRRLVEHARPAVNVVMLIGHNTLRGGVIGYNNTPASESDLAAMTRLLEQALDEGGRGFTTGLIYRPGMFASRAELTALAKVAGRRGGIYTSHIRSEGGHLLEALDEALAIGRAAGARVQIAHLKTSKAPNWNKLDAALGLIRAARNEGLVVGADRYPYTASWTSLDVILPRWAQEGGNDAELARLRDPSTRRRVREDLLRSLRDEDWQSIIIGSVGRPDYASYQGRRLADVAAELSLEPVDTALRIIESDELRTSAFYAWMNEENMIRILAEPYVMIGSDASIRALTGPLSLDFAHPRAYGTFPRFLRMAVDGKTVPLAEAVRKMTSLPAEQFGLGDRGVIARGRKADLVIFDPKTVRDASTYASPHQFGPGIEEVIVNGVLTLRGGAFTGDRAGRIL